MVTLLSGGEINSRESSEESIVDFCHDWKCCMYVVCCCRQGRRNVGWSSCHPRKCILPLWSRLTEGGLWSQCCVFECISAPYSAESSLTPI